VRRVATAMAAALLLTACAGGARSVPRMADMDRVRDGAAAREGKELAPQAFARAEQERTLSRQAYDANDDLAAQIYADRAIAAYEHAFILARLARATRELDAASEALGGATAQARQLAASRAEVEREGQETDKQLKVAREAIAPAASGPADPQREAARLVAARALTTEARLLCGSARLVAGDLAGLGDAEKELATLEAQVDAAAKPAPIDAAGRARARCLDVLTHARRAANDPASRADALLGEISASAGFDPRRDERGVVVTLRDLFKGATLTPEGDAKLKELGRVAAAHPGVAVQVVVHDASAPAKSEAEADRLRADAAAKAIVAGGAPAAKVKGETAGARAPLVDPSDAAHRARNARVDVVFVIPAG
jgi:flagellar motor protein MotB